MWEVGLALPSITSPRNLERALIIANIQRYSPSTRRQSSYAIVLTWIVRCFTRNGMSVTTRQVVEMSDRGTYALLAGLRENSPFTHLAPFSGVLHPEISMSGRIVHAKDKDIYLVHGTHDWMFPIETAYMAQGELEAAGARLTFRPVEGLSHTYARTENDAVLNWFNPSLAWRFPGEVHRRKVPGV